MNIGPGNYPISGLSGAPGPDQLFRGNGKIDCLYCIRAGL